MNNLKNELELLQKEEIMLRELIKKLEVQRDQLGIEELTLLHIQSKQAINKESRTQDQFSNPTTSQALTNEQHLLTIDSPTLQFGGNQHGFQHNTISIDDHGHFPMYDVDLNPNLNVQVKQENIEEEDDDESTDENGENNDKKRFTVL